VVEPRNREEEERKKKDTKTEEMTKAHRERDD
jgi:hypothetical protein